MTLARALDKISGSRITPNAVTFVALAAHIPVAWLIYNDYLLIAGILIIVFGLFDTLDGALARVQNVTSERGMFFDASTDRLKELFIYVGLIGLFSLQDNSMAVVIAALACGISLTVSYVKAKGEAAVAAASKKMNHQELNRLFEDGLGSYEIRIGLLAFGCILMIPEYFVAAILVIGSATLLIRTLKIAKVLS